MNNKQNEPLSSQASEGTNGEPLIIETFEQDTKGLLECVADLTDRIQRASWDYVHSGTILNLSDSRQNGNERLAWSINLGLRDLCLLGAIAQAPLALRGATDKGKTALAERALSGLFGPQSTGWWRLEVNRGITIDDLVDIDLSKLSDSKLSQAISSSAWVSLPALLLDEVNRSHAKLINLLLHIVDGSGLNLRGDLAIPIGMPYRVGRQQKRYAFSMVTANEVGGDTPGTYEEDAALTRRVVLSCSLDHHTVTTRDVAQLVNGQGRRARTQLPAMESSVASVIRIYESLPQVRFSALAQLLLHYLWGLGSCIRTRSGRVRRALLPAICNGCHLSKSHRFCGKVSGLSEGLLLWCREIARGLAVLRGAKVLAEVRRDCLEGSGKRVQTLLDQDAYGEDLYNEFARFYLRDFSVQGEDVVGAYTLIAPSHLWIDSGVLTQEAAYEKSESYAFADVAAWSWGRMQQLLSEHKTLFSHLAETGEISPANQSEVEMILTTKDAAMMAVISAFREQELTLRFPGNKKSGQVACSP